MEARQRLIDTLGNLTLLTESLNPSISNGPWSAKQPKIAESLLAMNRSIAKKDWSEDEIEMRAVTLTKMVNEIWPNE